MRNPPAHISFSVVIPAYNSVATIARSIDSCLQQTYAPAEIIVVDDNSSDATADAIAGYGDKIKYIRLHTNVGAAVARNKGMDAATGMYIAFLDADDVWHPEKLRLMATILVARPEISFIYHPFTSQSLDVTIPEGITIYRIPFVKLLTRNTIGTPCIVLRNDAKTRFHDELRYMEDYDLGLRVAYKRGVYFINVPLTQIGRPVSSTGGLSGHRWKMRKAELRVYTRLVRLNPLFILLLPLLYTLSISKHLYKLIFSR